MRYDMTEMVNPLGFLHDEQVDSIYYESGKLMLRISSFDNECNRKLKSVSIVFGGIKTIYSDVLIQLLKKIQYPNSIGQIYTLDGFLKLYGNKKIEIINILWGNKSVYIKGAMYTKEYLNVGIIIHAKTVEWNYEYQE